MQVRTGAALAALLLLAARGATDSTHPAGHRRREPEVRKPRRHGERVAVARNRIHADDGDTFTIRWPEGLETVRVLGVDAPETAHLQHEIPYAQPFGAEARAFAERTLAACARVEILRASTLDRYGRTLAYLFLDGRNYSVLILQARLAEEDVSRFGDSGFPREAAEVQAAAGAAGPLPFESPAAYRSRMRELSRHLKAQGRYPD